ncbi:hypothetical protein D9V32_11920 [Mycetocola tolaasinivorans]|uniref:Uncharacterized protein n=1 Tax=Mycetocola tolaasinivorans TaxID=76635 RepID=A0A3L7A4F8_9MICO|nr:hypothetical protein [Mycetocola tolaasinivorans]RLP74740.1 hypothetical protein D9V32_11920 [Mycetocola tolaasinivorans]
MTGLNISLDALRSVSVALHRAGGALTGACGSSRNSEIGADEVASALHGLQTDLRRTTEASQQRLESHARAASNTAEGFAEADSRLARAVEAG